MKKFLALLMAMSMVLAMVACSNTSGGNTGSGNTSGDDTNTSGDTGSTGGAELTFGTGGTRAPTTPSAMCWPSGSPATPIPA